MPDTWYCEESQLRNMPDGFGSHSDTILYARCLERRFDAPWNVEEGQLALDEVQGSRAQLSQVCIGLHEAALRQGSHAAVAQLPQLGGRGLAADLRAAAASCQGSSPVRNQ